MVEIGGRPILWHIMKHFAHYGFEEFVLALGYKGDAVKRWFLDEASLSTDLTVHMGSGEVDVRGARCEPWTVDLVGTGLKTQTGGRLKRLSEHLSDGTFMLAYSDGLTDLDPNDLLAFHRSHGKLATLTAVRPPARFGHLELDGDRVAVFDEKPQTGEGWINGAYFVLEPGVLDYIDGDQTEFSREPLERLAKDGQLMGYQHHGFWRCMDTLRDRVALEHMWEGGEAPWQVWPG
jgi:glucose-1-phosphate cytidylyltransferase